MPQRPPVNNISDPGNDWLGAKEVAELIGVSPATLQYWRSNNVRDKVPWQKFSGTVYYQRKHVLAFMAAARRGEMTPEFRERFEAALKAQQLAAE